MAVLLAWALARAQSNTASPTPIPTSYFCRGGRGIRPGALRPDRASVLLADGAAAAALAASREPFCQLAGAGLAVVTAVQAFINMGVAVSLLPAKGMTLPFISYGGSSLFSVALTMGFALAVTRQRPQDRCDPR